MKLINYENYEIKISDEAFLVKPIRKLYNADKTKTKEKFLQQMTIVYFMVDPRSSFTYLVDEGERFMEILKSEGLPMSTKIDKDLKEAMEAYQSHIETPSSLLLKDTLIAVDKLRTFLKEIDLNAVDEKGKPIYTVSTIVSAIKQIPQLAKDLVEMGKTIEKEITESSRIRGGSESKKVFEDGFDFND